MRPDVAQECLVEDQYRGCDYGRPEAALIADGGLGDIGRPDNFVGEAVDLLFLVPGAVRVEFDVKGRGQHLGREFLGIFTGGVLSFSEGMVLAEVAVGIAVRGDGDANRRGQEAVRFA